MPTETTMRTYDEIAEKIKSVQGEPFGFKTEVWIGYLPFEHAKQFLKAEVTSEEWEGGEEPLPYPLTRDGVLKEAADYMTFAVGKALDHRGISASRSVDKIGAWVWLLGADDHAAIDWDEYANYGCPVLNAVIERYGFDTLTALDEHGREAFSRMARGERCRDDCEDGCGH